MHAFQNPAAYHLALLELVLCHPPQVRPIHGPIPLPAMASAKVLVASSKVTLGETLASQIVEASREALSSRDVFVLALSGGSIPSLLGAVECQFSSEGIDPRWGSWHVVLADERCVPSTSPDSNFGSIKANFTSSVPIPADQVHGIDDFLTSESTSDIAAAYQDDVLKPLLARSGGKIDCAVLGFGPDGHTCSLFPDHPLLKETARLVAPIDDSPKPPPSRITLTFPVLNSMCRHVVFCGAGSSKCDIVHAVFESPTRTQLLEDGDPKCHRLGLRDPAPYPCGMVRPGNLIWIIDSDAACRLSTS